MILRPARSDEAEAVNELLNEAHAHHVALLPQRFRAVEEPLWSDAFVANAVEGELTCLLVADDGGSLAGMLLARLRDLPVEHGVHPLRVCLVDTLAVRADHRRRGVGRQLMAAAEAWAAGQGATEVELNVYAANADALAFYDRLGYQPLSHRMWRVLSAEVPLRPAPPE